MLPSKSKSGLSEASNNKSTPSTPRVSKLGRAGSTKSDPDSPSPSPQQNPRLSVDRSPRLLNSKPNVEHRSPKIISPPDKQPRALKGSELQAQLGVVQEDLKKERERLSSTQREKARALEELKDAKKLVDEMNEKLKEALIAQKRAEESLEIEKFRADEWEQTGIEDAQKREEEWRKELESVRNQHAVDVDALLSVTQELARVKQELAMASDAKNTSLSHADDASKIAEINAKKVELLSAEVSRLKVLLDSKLEIESTETTELVKKFDSETAALKQELEKAKAAEIKLVEMEELVEGLRIEVSDAKRAELDANHRVEEWKKEAELLEVRVEDAIQSEVSSRDSLATVTKQLEEGNASLQDAESEIALLKGKVESLEIEVARHKIDLEESDQRLDTAQQEALEMGKTIEMLKSEIQTIEEARTQALNNEKAAASNVESLSQERSTLIHELESTRDDREKVKKAMEGLASALHEVSMESRETQERFLTKQAEVESSHDQILELKQALKDSRESYEVMLDEAKYEIVCLRKNIERSESEAESLKAEWDAKEVKYVSDIKRSEEEVAAIKVEMDKVVDSLKGAEHESKIAAEDGIQLQNKLKQAVSEATVANEAVEEAKSKNLQLKERLLDKENALQSITQENDELRVRDAASQEKVKELSALLAAATIKKSEENGELSNNGKERVPLPRTVEIPEHNAAESEAGKPKSEQPSGKLDECCREDTKSKEAIGNIDAEDDEPLDVAVKIWEGIKIMDKDLSTERETEAESFDDDLDSKIDSGSLDQLTENMDNGATSPTKKQQQRKKKPLLHKFGSLLKKKSNHK